MRGNHQRRTGSFLSGASFALFLAPRDALEVIVSVRMCIVFAIQLIRAKEVRIDIEVEDI